MRLQLSWRLLGTGFLAVGLAAGSGCLNFLHPVEKPPTDCVELCQACPQRCRNHVYVFLMSGADPTDCGNLSGLSDRLQALGFTKTYCGCPYHIWWFSGELAKVHQRDPEARFVLIGSGLGGNVVDAIAWEARRHWIPIDLIVYLDCNTVGNSAADRPDNAARVLNIWSDGNLLEGVHMEGTENIRLRGAGPLGAPSHLATVETLAQELALVASRVPIEAPAESWPDLSPEAAPTPRPVMPQISQKRDDWDFLKPVNRYDQWPVLTGRRKGLAEPVPEGGKARPEKITMHSAVARPQ